MPDLHLNLKGEYFDQIKAGTKRLEFRLASKWSKRLAGKVFDRVFVKRGYPKAGDAERIIERPWRGYVLQSALRRRAGAGLRDHRELKGHRAMECNCDLRTKLVGDGCQVCNPKPAMTTSKVKPARDPIELACLRLFQQGRATYSDGRDHVRMGAGIAGTVSAVVALALGGSAFWLVLLVAFGGMVATSTWIVIAGQLAGQRRAAEIEARNRREG